MISFSSWWENYRRNGQISPIRIDMTRDEVRAVLGEPDDVGGTARKHRIPAIWKYGDVEFHFDHTAGGRLFLIYREDEVGNPQVIAKKS